MPLILSLQSPCWKLNVGSCLAAFHPHSTMGYKSTCPRTWSRLICKHHAGDQLNWWHRNPVSTLQQNLGPSELSSSNCNHIPIFIGTLLERDATKKDLQPIRWWVESSVADQDGVSWVPWNHLFEGLPPRILSLRKHNYVHYGPHCRYTEATLKPHSSNSTYVSTQL